MTVPTLVFGRVEVLLISAPILPIMAVMVACKKGVAWAIAMVTKFNNLSIILLSFVFFHIIHSIFHLSEE